MLWGKKEGSRKLWRPLLENMGVKLEKKACLKETGKMKNSKERNKQRREVVEEMQNKKVKEPEGDINRKRNRKINKKEEWKDVKDK